MPAAPKPVRCCFKGKTGAFYGQEGASKARQVLSCGQEWLKAPALCGTELSRLGSKTFQSIGC